MRRPLSSILALLLILGPAAQAQQDTPPGEVEMGAQPEAQSDDDRIAEEPDAGEGPAVDPGPFAFFDPHGQMQVAEGACGEEAMAWINTTFMDLDGTWTMEIWPEETPLVQGPLGGAGHDTVRIEADATESVVTIGGATFASRVPLEVVQSGEIPFAELPGEADITSERATAALGCAFNRLPRMTARGALLGAEAPVPFFLGVAVPNARALLGVLQTGEGDTAQTRLVRILR
ncbi:hypothetical protein [Roseicyclus sp.]|uniref:hypothetical protein n=1 Tax=Roseicyclus sp. TaxID=1914329 RepID=UPI003F9F9713